MKPTDQNSAKRSLLNDSITLQVRLCSVSLSHNVQPIIRLNCCSISNGNDKLCINDIYTLRLIAYLQTIGTTAISLQKLNDVLNNKSNKQPILTACLNHNSTLNCCRKSPNTIRNGRSISGQYFMCFLA